MKPLSPDEHDALVPPQKAVSWAICSELEKRGLITVHTAELFRFTFELTPLGELAIRVYREYLLFRERIGVS